MNSRRGKLSGRSGDERWGGRSSQLRLSSVVPRGAKRRKLTSPGDGDGRQVDCEEIDRRRVESAQRSEAGAEVELELELTSSGAPPSQSLRLLTHLARCTLAAASAGPHYG